MIKHATPCGAAVADDLVAAFRAARDGDSLSAFGGVVALNGPVEGACAAEMAGMFLEVVAAPSFLPDARERLAAKKNLIVLEGTAALGRPQSPGSAASRLPKPGRGNPRAGSRARLARGVGVARRDPAGAFRGGGALAPLRVESRARGALERDRSREGGKGIGIGGGQTSRIDALWVAIHKARREGHDLAGSVMASDAFFPFPDCVEEAAKVGVTAIIQPGGSKRDGDSIEAADRAGIAMVMNDARCFRHG